MMECSENENKTLSGCLRKGNTVCNLYQYQFFFFFFFFFYIEANFVLFVCVYLLLILCFVFCNFINFRILI